jgi:hypothetical protein
MTGLYAERPAVTLSTATCTGSARPLTCRRSVREPGWARAIRWSPKSPDLPVGWHWQPRRSDPDGAAGSRSGSSTTPRQEVHGWRAAIAGQIEIDRVYRAGEARVRAQIEACPERRDLVHGDLLHANVLVAEDARSERRLLREAIAAR